MTWESRESSSPILTRAVNAALWNKSIANYEFNVFQKILLNLIGNLPRNIALWLIPRVQRAGGLDPETVLDLSIDELIAERLQDYTFSDEKFPAVVMGLPIGGAAGHLATCLHAPFLPQTFVVTVQGGSIKGNIQEYFDAGVDIARSITAINDRVMTIQHFDPVHDGWLTKYVNHIRLKLLYLPEQYKAFIRKYVVDGGEVVILDGQVKWLQYKVSERNLFQVGGWGGITAEEFIKGSDRLNNYCLHNGLNKAEWDLKEYPLIKGYESEWGSETGFLEEVRAWCFKEGYKLHVISFEDPNDFSRLAYNAYRELFKRNHVQIQGVLVEMFSQYDLTAAISGGLLPLWLIFNTSDSLEYLKSMVHKFPEDRPVLFSLLSTFSLTPDMAPFSTWEDVLKGYNVINVGARKSHYPADTKTLINWQEKLFKHIQMHDNQENKWLNGADLKITSKKMKSNL